jgi:ATP-dependent DNA helicase RecG
MHRPSSEAHYESSRQRLAFQELLCLQLKLLLQRAALRLPRGGEALAGVRLGDWRLAALARAALPFQLTPAQERAVATVAEGVAGWPPMMCLLQGDVGCGKTAVAFLALLAAAGSGYQAAIMAPTEILAEQHYRGLTQLVEHMRAAAAAGAGAGGAAPRLPTVALLTGSSKRAERGATLAALAAGELDLLVGTHALIGEGVSFASLGLAVIDEQHKFGVQQRARLLAKASPAPHVLSMSATPIPRSLALVLHGELTLATIDEMPPGRAPVATRVLPDAPAARKEMYAHMRRELAEGGQVFIVCPLVEEGGGGGGERELKAAVSERARLVAEGVLEAGQCGVLHGRMGAEEKEAALRAFASGAAPVIVTTTVIEVGVDVPVASMVIVEHADRFGLAQLHQLRGRVGRGARAASCWLVTDRGGEEAARLSVLESCASGFEVAEADFRLRGAGELLGQRQSGRDVAGALRACRLPGDAALLERAREAAALHMDRCRGTPEGWAPELLAAVADPSLLELDLAELPSVEPA